jgi:hypothetical protein
LESGLGQLDSSPCKYWLLPLRVIITTYPPMKMKPIQCSETSAYIIQTPGNYPEDNILHRQHGESLKTTINNLQYIVFWVVPWGLKFISRRFGTLYRFHLHKWVDVKMELIECSETSAYIIQTRGNYPEDNTILHQQHGESL